MPGMGFIEGNGVAYIDLLGNYIIMIPSIVIRAVTQFFFFGGGGKATPTKRILGGPLTGPPSPPPLVPTPGLSCSQDPSLFSYNNCLWSAVCLKI